MYVQKIILVRPEVVDISLSTSVTDVIVELNANPCNEQRRHAVTRAERSVRFEYWEEISERNTFIFTANRIPYNTV